MASGSNAPIITNALVAWPPPPSSARFATSPPLSARKQRFSYVPSVHSPPQSPSTASFGNPGSAYPTHPSSPLSPLSGYATPPKPTLAAPAPVSARDREREARLASASGSDDDGRGPPDRELGQRHDYPPPAKPLSPAQLARIAQSFGIVIPSLSNGGDLRTPISISPSPSPVPPVLSNGIKSPTSPHARPPNAPGPSSSGQVVAVVPPASLLPQAPDTDAATAHDRARRWRRGRLVPLQPTLGGMLVAIAREFGLPSTTGVSVYLGQQGGVGAGASRVSTASVDSEPGPLITPATWIALFGSAARSGSPASTPSGTPRKAHQAHNPRNASTATFGGGFPITPLAPLSEDTSYAPSASTTRTTASDEPELRDSKSSASSFAQPPTPASATLTASSFPQLPVFGTIEFDVDPTEARWLEDWLRSGGPSRRTGAAAAAGLEIPGAGIRELTLVERLKDDRPKFLRDMEREAARAQERREETERLALAEADAARFARAQSEPLPQQHTRSGSESRSPPVSPKGPRRMPPRHLPGGVLGSAAALRVRNPDVDADGNPIEESEEGMDTLSALASPIALPRRLNTELGRLDDDQRASAYVMEDQLNNLEKMMRDLSPRPFQVGPPRKTSKGALRPTTPVRAIGHLGQVSPDAFDRLSVIGSSSRLPYLQPDHVPAPGELSRRSVSQPNPAKGTASAPASALATSPLSPPWRSTSLASAGEQVNGANGFGHAREGSRGATTAPVTPNPMSPGSTPGPNGSTGATPTEGKHRLSRFGPAPPRPARPPTPDLTTPDLIPHVLPPEKVDVIKNTTAPLPSPTTRARPTSMSLRGLKRQVSTSLAGNTKGRQPESRSYRENGDEGHKATGSIGSGSAGGSGSFSGSGSAPYPISSGPSSATSPRIAVSSVPGSGLSSSPREPPSAFSYTPPSSIYLASTSTSGGHPRTASGTTLTSDDEGHNAHNRRSRFFGFGKKRESRDLDGSHTHAHSHSHSSRNTIVHISSPIGTTHKTVSPAELAASMGIPTPPIPPRVPAPADDITSPIGLSPHMASTNASAISINSHADSPRSPYASGTATPGSFGGATPGMFESGAGTPTGTGTPGVSPVIPGHGVNGTGGDEGLSPGSSDEHSPRQVRRKPVPGMQGRGSVQSVDEK